MAAAVHAACACVGGLAVWAGGERKEPEDDNAHSDTYPHAAPRIGLHTCLQAVVYSMTCFSLTSLELGVACRVPRGCLASKLEKS